MRYEIPKMELVEYMADDVIRTSSTTTHGSMNNGGAAGYEPEYKWTDIF